MNDNSPPKEETNSKLGPYIALSTTIVVVIGIGLNLLGFTPPLQQDRSPNSARVEVGRYYYVFVSLVELSDVSPQGDAWDSTNGSAPDIYVEIYWKGQRVFQSTTKEDTLVAKWSNAEVDLIKMALQGKKTSVDAVINAARINIAEGESIEIRVFDNDLLGSYDTAGEIELKTDSLALGDSTYEFESGGVKKLVLRVLDMSTTPDILR